MTAERIDSPDGPNPKRERRHGATGGYLLGAALTSVICISGCLAGSGGKYEYYHCRHDSYPLIKAERYYRDSLDEIDMKMGREMFHDTIGIGIPLN